MCTTCNLHRLGQSQRANHAKHSEGCRHRVYDLLLQEGAAKAKLGHTEGRHPTKSSSSTTKPPDPHIVLTHDEPNTRADSDDGYDVEYYKVGIVDQEMYLNAKDLVEDDGPHADLDPVLASDDYNDLVDRLQVAGVDVIDAVR